MKRIPVIAMTLMFFAACGQSTIKPGEGNNNENKQIGNEMINQKPFKLMIADADYLMAIVYHFILTENSFEIIFKGGLEGEKDSAVFKLDIIPDSILNRLATIEIGHLEEKYVNPCISDGSQLKVTWEAKDYNKTVRLSNYYQPDIALLIDMINSLTPEKYRIWYDKEKLLMDFKKCKGNN